MLILISPPTYQAKELDTLIKLFENGLSYFHLRKPNSKKNDLEQYIQNIPTQFWNRIVLHQHHELTSQFNLRGVHFTSFYRNHLKFEDWQKQCNEFKNKGFTISTSTHHFDEVKQVQAICDYVFVSPIFDSISKTGYLANKDLQKEIQHFEKSTTCKLIALGGITENNLQEALALSFDGIAVLGRVWSNKNDSLNAFKLIQHHYDFFFLNQNS